VPSQSIRLEGLPGLKRALAGKEAALHAAASRAVADEVEKVRSDARREAPRDTGDLIGHIDGSADGIHGRVKSTSRHAGFVEHGTYKDKAQPYMRPAAEKARGRFPRTAVAIIKEALGR
jgi:HK97 gp10 family phage protein